MDNFWLLKYWHEDDIAIEDCLDKAFRNFDEAINKTEKEMRKLWCASNKACGRTVMERDELIEESLQDLKNNNKAQIADFCWKLTNLKFE